MPHRLAYADMPSVRCSSLQRGVLGGARIGVSRHSDAPDIAKAFAAWVASEPVQSGVLLANERHSEHRAAWSNKAEDLQFAGFLGGVWRTMDTACTRPRGTWFLGFADDVCEIFPDFS